MDPPLPSQQLTLKLVQPFSEELVRELSSSVQGRVLRPPDPEYVERSKMFNGKLKCLSRLVVVPLDAHDVSAAVKFCARHGLSPSVRAGGYGIAGWAVAGDVIIDLSAITDIDIEPPRQIPEGSDGTAVDWTPMKDMPPPGSKGKAKAPVPPTPAAGEADVNRSRTGKRRREDRSPSVDPLDARPPGSQGPYDDASPIVAAFLRGPPLPPEPGEHAREPPLNRARHHSPDRTTEDETASQAAPTLQPNVCGARVEMPPLNEDTRQLSRESNSSDGSSRQSTFGFDSRASQSSAATTTAPSPSIDRKPSGSVEAREPFGYLTPGSAPTPAPRLPMYSAPAASGSEGTSAAAAPGFGVSYSSSQHQQQQILTGNLPPAIVGPPVGMSSWTRPAAASFGTGMPAGVSSLPMAPSWTMGPGQGPFAMPAGAFPGFNFPPSLFGIGGDGRSGQLGAVPYSTPVHAHAYVTFGAGLRQKEVDLYTADHPLQGTNSVTGETEDAAVPYHVPMSAHPVGSSIMLLGGFGFISRMYGLSIDNLVEVEMVLADGRIIIVNADEDPELWWAVRGAGPAFGIATRYKARAFPVPVVFAGNIIYRFHRSTAPSLIKHFRDCIKGAPRELYANVLLTAGPADKDSLIVIQLCYVGPKEKGMEYLQAISSWDGERCLLNEVNEKSFLNQQDSVAQILRGKAGRQWFIRSALITTLPDEVINKTVLEFADTPIGCTWIFELSGGAIGDFEDNCLPKEQREATWTVAALHQWDMGIDDPRCITTAEQVSLCGLCCAPLRWMGGTIKQVSVGGPYPTFLGRHEPPERTMACFGKNWDRLSELKRKYDPTCLFKNNFWPLDRHGRPVEFLANEPPSP
ncbi:hypothetical protein PYCCODRAFT_1378794 [Trametes coccinea BRFM310]|uniref:Berberine/berberine-like domain-containing protein n=1 Tax=Trametes coccinea (strain BRFM310) TaxID=1353009 RepID=A0A1Y2I827_TRAC3|nr:hypothetical protein PYCCODRAFT_1378794 [Trametes coccinea BRFM310]